MVTLVLTIALFGFIVWLITQLIPMPPQFVAAIYAISLILILLYVFRVVGFHDIPIR
jgi:hypothetical protein